MNSASGLHIATVVLSFSLRVAAAFCISWLLDGLLRRPRPRFLAWTLLLVASIAYWIGLIAKEVYAWRAPFTAGTPGAKAGSFAMQTILLPAGWSYAVLFALKIIGLAYVS